MKCIIPKTDLIQYPQIYLSIITRHVKLCYKLYSKRIKHKVNYTYSLLCQGLVPDLKSTGAALPQQDTTDSDVTLLT